MRKPSTTKFFTTPPFNPLLLLTQPSQHACTTPLTSVSSPSTPSLLLSVRLCSPHPKYSTGKDLGNAQAIRLHSGLVPVFELPPLPPAEEPLGSWYSANAEGFHSVLDALAERRSAGVRDVLGMKERGKKAIWWPFTQHDEVTDADVTVLDSAYGDYFCSAEVEEGQGSDVSVALERRLR